MNPRETARNNRETGKKLELRTTPFLFFEDLSVSHFVRLVYLRRKTDMTDKILYVIVCLIFLTSRVSNRFVSRDEKQTQKEQ